jgi:hypothetical protein
VSAFSTDLSMEGRLRALREGPYGRCVYHCDNNVVDHHVVNMEFESDATLTFTMQGHSYNNVRTMRYDGAKATLRASEGRQRDHHLRPPDGHRGDHSPGRGGGWPRWRRHGRNDAFVATLAQSTPVLTSARPRWKAT